MTSLHSKELPVAIDDESSLTDSDLESLKSYGDSTIHLNPGEPPIQRKALNAAKFLKAMELHGDDPFSFNVQRYRAKVKLVAGPLNEKKKALEALQEQLGDPHIVSPNASGDVDSSKHNWPQLLEALQLSFKKIVEKTLPLKTLPLQTGSVEEIVKSHHHIYALVKEFKKICNRLEKLGDPLYAVEWKEEFLDQWEQVDEEFCKLCRISPPKEASDEPGEAGTVGGDGSEQDQLEEEDDDDESVQSYRTAPTSQDTA